MHRRTPGLPVHYQLLEFTQTHVHRVRDASSHLILGRPLLLLTPIPPSIRVFSNELTLRMRWPKYWSFSFSIIPSKEIPGWSPSEWTGWISCSPRDSQESSPTPQFKSINLSVLSFVYSPNPTSIYDYWKTIALTRLTFVGKVMSLLFNGCLGWS